MMEEPFTPPLPSRATRKLPLRSRSSSRGSLVNPKTRRVIDYHSCPERGTLLVGLARRDVVDIQEQAPAVRFIDFDGKPRAHYFDFVMELTSGQKVAIAVKPHEKAVKKHLTATLDAIAKQLPPGFADAVSLVTERDLHPDDVYNAELIQSVRLHPNIDMNEKVRAIVRTLIGAATIESVVAQFENRGVAFRSIVHLIYLGELQLVGSRRITHGAHVAWTSNTEAAA